MLGPLCKIVLLSQFAVRLAKPKSVTIADSPIPGQNVPLSVGPGAGIQLSANNPHHPNRLVVRASVPAPVDLALAVLIRGCRVQFAGHHGAYTYDMVWFSDDGGQSYQLAKNATGGPLQIWGQDEIALAETPDGGVITSTRNEDYHKGYNKAGAGCNCRGKARSTDGGEPHAYWYRR